MDWTDLGGDAENKLKVDMELPSMVMALISILKDKGILGEADLEVFNNRQKHIQGLMFETAKGVGILMSLHEEGDLGNVQEALSELEKVIENSKILMEMCGRGGMIGELTEALEQARAAVDVFKSEE